MNHVNSDDSVTPQNDLLQYLKQFRYPKPTYDFYTITLLNMLKCSCVDEDNRVCIYFDEYLRNIFEEGFNCEKSMVKLYVKKLKEMGLLAITKSVENNGEYKDVDGLSSFTYNVNAPRATYYLDYSLTVLLRDVGITFVNYKLDLLQLKSDEEIKNMVAKPDVYIPERAMKLFHAITNRLIMFSTDNQQQKINNLIRSFLRFSRQQQKKLNIIAQEHQTGQNVESANSDRPPNQYFIFITDETRQDLMDEMKYKSSYFHEDLTYLCKSGILEKVSAYRFFLNPDCLINNTEYLEKLLSPMLNSVLIPPSDEPTVPTLDEVIIPELTPIDI